MFFGIPQSKGFLYPQLKQETLFISLYSPTFQQIYTMLECITPLPVYLPLFPLPAPGPQGENRPTVVRCYGEEQHRILVPLFLSTQVLPGTFFVLNILYCKSIKMSYLVCLVYQYWNTGINGISFYEFYTQLSFLKMKR